jgi:GNAT superfamily N-acetyltransferase
MSPTVLRVPWLDARAVALRDAMDAEMTALYAPDFASVSDEENAIVLRALEVDDSEILTSILAVDDGVAVGHTALRPRGDALEVKKVVVAPQQRGRGISKLLMREVEAIARERGVTSLILQTGNRQPEAVSLYLAMGYEQIPVFPPYDVMAVSLCYGKTLAVS